MSGIRTTSSEAPATGAVISTTLDADGTLVVRPAHGGPIDAPAFREAAAAALAGHRTASVRLDLTGTGRLDAAGLAVIVQCRRAAASTGGALTVIPGDAADQAVLTRLGLDQLHRVADAA